MSAAQPPAFARTVTSKAGGWITLVLVILLVGLVMGMGSESSNGEAPDTLPGDAESAQVDEIREGFPESDSVPAVLVVTREDDGALDEADIGAVAQLGDRLAEVAGGEPAIGPIPSEDGQAVMLNLPLPADQATGEDGTELVEELRGTIADELPGGLSAQLTGGPAFAADSAAAFDGADLRLLIVTALVVAVLLIITYRSPVLWLVPLTVVALADRFAATIIDPVASAFGIPPDMSTAGITSVLVFGAGTNYALLLVARYREELRRHRHHRDALAIAWKPAAKAIISSNVTVVLALLLLLFASLPNYRALGLSAAIGLLVALVFGLVALPAALACCGRGLFWPFVPKYEDQTTSDDPSGDRTAPAPGVWGKIAGFVIPRPVVVLVASALVLSILALGFLGTRVGLSQYEQFRTETESAQGIETVAEHFPAGATDPVFVVAQTDQADAVEGVIRQADGVTEVRPSEESGGWSEFTVTIDSGTGTERSEETITTLREQVHAIDGAEALVGGAAAKEIDTSDANVRDLMVLVPLILAVVFAVLVIILRALVAPLLLMIATTLSSLAAIGLGTFVATQLFGFPGLDVSVPLYSLLFLVALGIDYSIFLTLRAREEAERIDTRDAILRAVSLTGGVITSAGVVLAAVFVVLGVLPLLVLTQVGIIVSLGILLDTFLVRTVVVPALFSLLGEKVWWPSRPRASREAGTVEV